MSDDRKQSMMDYQPENMHFRKSSGRRLKHGLFFKRHSPSLFFLSFTFSFFLEPLTSNLPVSPPHSPVSSKSNAQEEVSTHRPTVPHYHFNFLDDESDPMPYASAQERKDEALTQTQQQWETKQPVQQQQTMKLKASDFCLERTLGTGSFGRVHLVQSNVNHLYYAMKVLSKELVVRKKQVEHTVNERSVLMAVDYPFLIKLWGTFQDAANLYMVMEFVSGGEVFSLLRKQQVSQCF
jgi:protein kinase A